MNDDIEYNELSYHKRVNILSNQNQYYFKFENYVAPNMYDHNFLYLKQIPSLKDFVDIYEFNKYRKYLKLYFPFNINLPSELLYFLISENFEVEELSYQLITKQALKKINFNKKIEVLEVDNENLLKDYLKLNYEEDIFNGKDFAEEKESLNKKLYLTKQCKQYTAYYERKAVGSLELFKMKNEVNKVENLFVNEIFRNKRIASSLIYQVFMKNYSVTDSIYAAIDINDSISKKFYEKLNFTQICKQKTFLKFIDKLD